MDVKSDDQAQNETSHEIESSTEPQLEVTPAIENEKAEDKEETSEKTPSEQEEQNSGEKQETFCSNCGKKLEETEEFCSKCGTQRNTVITPSTPSASASIPISNISSVVSKAKEKKGKSKLPLIGVVLIIVIVIVLVVVFLMPGKKQVNFQEVYDSYCKSTWAKVGQDGSYLSIDTNPYDKDDGDYRYVFEANNAIKDVNAALGFNDSVYDDMQNTTALMGKQTETNENGAVSVSWTYHPDHGLEVTYKKAKQ